MRKRPLPLLIVCLFLFAACSDAVESEAEPDVSVAASPTASSSVSATPSQGDLSPSVAPSPSKAPFGTVVREFRFDEQGEIRLAVHFANPKVMDRPDLAEECVDFFGDEDVDTVSCYAYESEAAVEAADPDPSTGGVAELCWRSYFSRSSSGASGGSETNPSYGKSCP